MKTVHVAFKKIEIVDYYPQYDQVKIRILFNDGADKGFQRQITITNPEAHIEEWLKEIRYALKDAHNEHSLEDHPLANAIIIRYKQEQDVLQERMSRFLAQTKERIRSGKLAKLSYYDMEQKLKGFSLKFD